MNAVTYTAAARELRALGLRVSRDEYGEIRVGFPGNESAAYYTDCPEDALATGKAMAAERAPESDAEGEAIEAGTHVPGQPFDGATCCDCGAPLDAEARPHGQCWDCCYSAAPRREIYIPQADDCARLRDIARAESERWTGRRDVALEPGIRYNLETGKVANSANLLEVTKAESHGDSDLVECQPWATFRGEGFFLIDGRAVVDFYVRNGEGLACNILAFFDAGGLAMVSDGSAVAPLWTRPGFDYRAADFYAESFAPGEPLPDPCEVCGEVAAHGYGCPEAGRDGRREQTGAEFLAEESAEAEAGVHRFESSGAAYDATQCRDDIGNGDALIAAPESVVGLAWTWPVAVTVESGHFHEPRDGDIESARALLRGMDASAGHVARAVAAADRIGAEVAPWARTIAREAAQDRARLAEAEAALDATDSEAEAEQIALAIAAEAEHTAPLFGPVPARLNGFPVIHSEPRHGDSFFVIVDRGADFPAHRFVRATWARPCGDSWTWGHYFGDLREALESIAEARGEVAPGPRSLSAAAPRLGEQGRRKYAERRRATVQTARRGESSRDGFHAATALRLARSWEADPDRAKRLYTSESIWTRPGNNPPFDSHGTRARWIENPESCGLRFVGLVHDMGGASPVNHSGWFLDPDGDAETVAGVVYRLPGANGRARYLYGYADPWNCDRDGRGPACLALEVVTGERIDSSWDTDSALRDAASWADNMAERMAEAERDYQAAWRDGVRARELAQEARKAGRAMVAQCRALRALWRARGGSPALPGPMARDALRAALGALREARAAYSEALGTARDYRDENRPGPWFESARDGFHNGYQEGV